MEGFLATLEWAAVLLRDAVDGLNVHQQIVADAEAPPTLLTLQRKKKQRKKEAKRKRLKRRKVFKTSTFQHNHLIPFSMYCACKYRHSHFEHAPSLLKRNYHTS